MSVLPIANCESCGACCFEQGSPPGYLYLLLNIGNWAEWPDQDDVARVQALLPVLVEELRLYGQMLKAGNMEHDGPCIWLDVDTSRCSHYAERPSICRELDVGSEGCRNWRYQYDIGAKPLTAGAADKEE